MINLNESITSLMIKDVLTIGPKSTLMDVADLFDLKHIHHIPVVEGEKLVGLVSKTDFLFFRHRVEEAAEKSREVERLKQHTVDRIMARNVASLSPNHTLVDALNVFKKNYFHALPIVEDKKLLGIVTPMDIMNYIINNVST